MVIKGDIQKDEVKDIQNQREVCPPVRFRDMKSNQCQQMAEVHNEYPLPRGHKERRNVGKS